MMSSIPPEDPGHADDLFSVTTYEAPLPQRKDFLAWHAPRKQFVRERQWCEQIGLMLDESPLADGILRYLGLPGVDLLDLRHFHKRVCEVRDLRLRFLGFNSAAQPSSQAQTELNVSLDEVRRMPRVDRNSDVIGDNFTRLANESSIAWQRTQAIGPYDVVNLDLCDGFGAHPPDTVDDTYYDAVAKLMSLQARSPRPWLLLLTTRVGQGHIHPEVLRKLIEKFLVNLATCPPFKIMSGRHFAIENEASLKLEVATTGGLLPVFLCGLCKWLIGISLGQEPPSRVEVKSVIGYRVDQEAEYEDLISLALRFTPTFKPAGDPVGLAKPAVGILKECDLSVQALKRITKRRDVDRILVNDPALNIAMIEAMADLLELARYDVAAYRDWVSAR